MRRSKAAAACHRRKFQRAAPGWKLFCGLSDCFAQSTFTAYAVLFRARDFNRAVSAPEASWKFNPGNVSLGSFPEKLVIPGIYFPKSLLEFLPGEFGRVSRF